MDSKQIILPMYIFLRMKNEGRLSFLLYGLYFHAKNDQAACIKPMEVL